MRPSEIEGRAYSVIQRVQAGQPIEDVRVELKSEWPKDEHGAARRIAGHANSAHGEPILWLIGIDEKGKQIVGANYVELANWWSKVQALFVELPPDMTPLMGDDRGGNTYRRDGSKQLRTAIRVRQIC